MRQPNLLPHLFYHATSSTERKKRALQIHSILSGSYLFLTNRKRYFTTAKVTSQTTDGCCSLALTGLLPQRTYVEPPCAALEFHIKCDSYASNAIYQTMLTKRSFSLLPSCRIRAIYFPAHASTATASRPPATAYRSNSDSHYMRRSRYICKRQLLSESNAYGEYSIQGIGSRVNCNINRRRIASRSDIGYCCSCSCSTCDKGISPWKSICDSIKKKSGFCGVAATASTCLQHLCVANEFATIFGTSSNQIVDNYQPKLVRHISNCSNRINVKGSTSRQSGRSRYCDRYNASCKSIRYNGSEPPMSMTSWRRSHRSLEAVHYILPFSFILGRYVCTASHIVYPVPLFSQLSATSRFRFVSSVVCNDKMISERRLRGHFQPVRFCRFDSQTFYFISSQLRRPALTSQLTVFSDLVHIYVMPYLALSFWGTALTSEFPASTCSSISCLLFPCSFFHSLSFSLKDAGAAAPTCVANTPTSSFPASAFMLDSCNCQTLKPHTLPTPGKRTVSLNRHTRQRSSRFFSSPHSLTFLPDACSNMRMHRCLPFLPPAAFSFYSFPLLSSSCCVHFSFASFLLTPVSNFARLFVLTEPPPSALPLPASRSFVSVSSPSRIHRPSLPTTTHVSSTSPNLSQDHSLSCGALPTSLLSLPSAQQHSFFASLPSQFSTSTSSSFPAAASFNYHRSFFIGRHFFSSLEYAFSRSWTSRLTAIPRVSLLLISAAYSSTASLQPRPSHATGSPPSADSRAAATSTRQALIVPTTETEAVLNVDTAGAAVLEHQVAAAVTATTTRAGAQLEASVFADAADKAAPTAADDSCGADKAAANKAAAYSNAVAVAATASPSSLLSALWTLMQGDQLRLLLVLLALLLSTAAQLAIPRQLGKLVDRISGTPVSAFSDTSAEKAATGVLNTAAKGDGVTPTAVSKAAAAAASAAGAEKNAPVAAMEQQLQLQQQMNLSRESDVHETALPVATDHMVDYGEEKKQLTTSRVGAVVVAPGAVSRGCLSIAKDSRMHQWSREHSLAKNGDEQQQPQPQPQPQPQQQRDARGRDPEEAAARFASQKLLQRCTEMLQPSTAAACALIVLLGTAASFVRLYLLETTIERVASQLRRTYFTRLLREPTWRFGVERSGAILHRMSTEITQASRIFVDISFGLRCVITALAGILVAASLAPSSFLLSLLLPVGGAAFAVRLTARKSRHIQAAHAAALSSAIQHAQEVLVNRRAVRTLNAEALEIQTFGQQLDLVYKLARRNAVALGCRHGLLFAVGGGFLVHVVRQAGSLLAAGTVSLGDMTAVALYCMMAGSSIQGSFAAYSDLQRGLGVAAAAISHIVAIPSAPSPSSAALLKQRKQQQKQHQNQRACTEQQRRETDALLRDDISANAKLKINDSGNKVEEQEWPQASRSGKWGMRQKLERQCMWIVQAVLDFFGMSSDYCKQRSFVQRKTGGCTTSCRTGWNAETSSIRPAQNTTTAASSLAPARRGADIEFRDVWFAYPASPDTYILKDLNLHIPSGARMAILGRSGSGKSTLATLLLRLYDPSRGTIYVNTIPTTSVDQPLLRSITSVVSQEGLLLARSLRENVAYALRASDFATSRYTSEENVSRGIELACKVADAEGFLRRLPNGLSTVVDEKALSLSGGQRQRIHIARALCRFLARPSSQTNCALDLEPFSTKAMPYKAYIDVDAASPYEFSHNGEEKQIPPASESAADVAVTLMVDAAPLVLIMDEATSALDLQTERRVLSQMKEALCGYTCLMITHRLTALDFAQYIAVLSEGRVVQCGHKSEVLSDPCDELQQILACSNTTLETDFPRTC